MLAPWLKNTILVASGALGFAGLSWAVNNLREDDECEEYDEDASDSEETAEKPEEEEKPQRPRTKISELTETQIKTFENRMKGVADGFVEQIGNAASAAIEKINSIGKK